MQFNDDFMVLSRVHGIVTSPRDPTLYSGLTSAVQCCQWTLLATEVQCKLRDW